MRRDESLNEGREGEGGAGEGGERKRDRAFANSNHMEDRKRGNDSASPPRFGKWILLTGSYALLAVSSRRSCTNRGKRDREETSSEGERQREERRGERGEVNGVETNLKILPLQGWPPRAVV